MTARPGLIKHTESDQAVDEILQLVENLESEITQFHSDLDAYTERAKALLLEQGDF